MARSTQGVGCDIWATFFFQATKSLVALLVTAEALVSRKASANRVSSPRVCVNPALAPHRNHTMEYPDFGQILDAFGGVAASAPESETSGTTSCLSLRCYYLLPMAKCAKTC